MKRTPIAAAVAALFLFTASSVYGQAAATSPSTSSGRPGANATGMGNTPSGAAVPGSMTADKAASKAADNAADRAAAKSGDTRATRLSSGDRKFIESAAHDGLKEVELGRLASEKGSDPAVKKFGERMVKDHGDANKKLMDLAQSKGVTPPSAIEKGDQRDIDKLAKRSGVDFDEHYMAMMVKEHKKDVKEFQKQAKSKDADIAQFASATLPTLQEHLSLAQSTEKQVTASKRNGAHRSVSSAGSTMPGSTMPGSTMGGSTTTAAGTAGGMSSGTTTGATRGDTAAMPAASSKAAASR